MASGFGSCADSSNLVVDLLSPLMTILTPPIKPGATHLLASDERALLHELIDHMLSLGLRYVQRPADEGGYAHRLEPALATLLPSATAPHATPAPSSALPASPATPTMARTAGERLSNAEEENGAAPPVNSGLVRELPAAVKQMLSAELQREVMRRHRAQLGRLERVG